MMDKRKFHLINGILFLFIASIILFASLSIVMQITSFQSRSKKQAAVMQQDYLEDQKDKVKREVQWVADFAKSRLAALKENTGNKVQLRTQEAVSIAESLYDRNKDKVSDERISAMIKDALLPIRYSEGSGYYFILTFSGTGILFAENRGLEGRNLYDVKDAGGQYITRDMISLCRDKGEGLYEYLWTRPGTPGNEFRKISYVKSFEPLHWIIGTGLYLKDEEAALEKELLEDISEIRFDTAGYVSVNTADGEALVSKGNVIIGSKKLWDISDTDPAQTKILFSREQVAAADRAGGFIYYKTPDDTPMISFVLSIPDLNWLIEAEVNLDDVSDNIEQIRELSFNELRKDLAETVLLTLLLMGSFSFFFVLMGRSLKRDFGAFAVFFENSLNESSRVPRESLRFTELIELADQANGMQSEKVEALRKLKESEARFRLLAENSRDMIFKLAFPEGTMEYVSPASVEITGYTPEEIQSEPFFIRKVIHPEWSEWLEEHLKNLNNGEVEDYFEYQTITKDGEARWVSQRNSVIPGEKEGSFILIGRVSDETRRKKAEEDLNLSYRLEAVGKLAGGVAHDFNNVLAGIMNAATVLKSPKRQIDEKGRNMADLILQAATRAADLTNKLSAFSGKRTLLLKPVDVHHIITETEVLLRRTIDKQIEIHLDLQAKDFYVIGDGTELQSIILNLSINGSHAISGNGIITLSTGNRNLSRKFCNESPFNCVPGKYLELRIIDTGSGIPPDSLRRIFEPFFTTKEKGKGTGLGLATVYKSVLDHKGVISVESEVGSGTVFSILLPCTEKVPDSKKKEISPTIGSGRILFIDDEEFVRTSGKGMLEEQGYAVETASNGREGVEIFRQSPDLFDVVILDVIMPVMGGIDAFFEIRKIRRECPVVMISGHTRQEELAPLRRAGISFLLRKPFSATDLHRAINEAIELSSAEPS